MTSVMPISQAGKAVVLAIVVPDDARLLDVARQANRLGLLLATNGRGCLMVREVPAGWTRIRTNEKFVCRKGRYAAYA